MTKIGKSQEESKREMFEIKRVSVALVLRCALLKKMFGLIYNIVC